MDSQYFKSNKEIRGKRLKIIRKLSGLTRQAMTDKYGIPYGNFQNWEDGRYSGLTEEGAKTMLKAYAQEGVEATLEWLMHGVEPGPKITSKFYTKNNPKITVDDLDDQNAENTAIIRELMLFKEDHQQQVLAMIVNDDGMEPYYHIGEYVAGKFSSGKDILQLIGQDCIVECDNNLYLRHLKSGNTEDSFNLICHNSRTTAIPAIYDSKITRAAPVMWLRRKDLR